jgi:hypothetical protein
LKPDYLEEDLDYLDEGSDYLEGRRDPMDPYYLEEES